MQSHDTVLHSVRLFDGIQPNHLSSMLACLGAQRIPLQKDSCALMAGEQVEHVGIVLEGRFLLIREDRDGGRNLLATLSPGDFFGEALCCAGVNESPVSVVADTDGLVMRLAFQRILHVCPNACAFHTRLLENMLGVLAGKNLQLQQQLDFLSQKTIRVRLLRYLETQTPGEGREFSIPFNREELADFLCVDRSALSREMARLKAEGLIDYWKNTFKLFPVPPLPRNARQNWDF